MRRICATATSERRPGPLTGIGPGPRRSEHAASGFTLIEILVVLFVVATLVGVSVLELGGRDRDGTVRDEAQRLRLTMELARERALIGSSEWGLRVDDDGYRFLRLDPLRGRWQEVEDRPFAAHDLPEDLRLVLTITEGQPPPPLRGEDVQGETPLRPSLVLLSSGEITAFDLRLVPPWEGRTWRVHSDGLAPVASEPAG